MTPSEHAFDSIAKISTRLLEDANVGGIYEPKDDEASVSLRPMSS